jgi:ATP-dependent RNA helicase DeaD
LTHVINFTLPDEVEAYTHRSGRTGRAGKTGISIAIINLREKHKIRAIERIINKTFEPCKMPTGKEICNKQIFNLMSRLEKVEVNEVEIADVLPSVYRKLDWLDKEDLIKRLVSLEFSRLIEYYQDNEDIETIEGVFSYVSTNSWKVLSSREFYWIFNVDTNIYDESIEGGTA